MAPPGIRDQISANKQPGESAALNSCSLITDAWQSRFLLVLDVADDIGHVLVAFLLLLDEGGVVHLLVLELDLVLAALGRPFRRLLALGLGVRLLQRDEFGLLGLRRLGFLLGGGLGAHRLRSPAGGD